MSQSLGTSAAKGALWSGIDRFGIMVVQFVVNMVLARLLTPSDFGVIGMLNIFILVSSVLVDSGFGSSLIQKKQPTELDYSTVFTWNLSSSLILYLILFLLAPFISTFYEMPILKKVLRYIGLSLIFSGIVSLQVNRLQKHLQFKLLSISDILSYTVSAVITIIFAYKGYGVWSLVILTLIQPILRVVSIYWVTRWLPKLEFSINSFKQLLSFGGYLLVGNLIESICNNLQGLIIGKKYSASDLGYYNQAFKLFNVISYSVPQVIASVIYPVFSSVQEDRKRMNDIFYRSIRLISFVIYPILSFLILEAKPIILGLYGNQWENAILYFQILCCGGFFFCLNNIPYYAVASLGKSKQLFYASIYKWLFFAVLLLVGMNFGMDVLVSCIAVSYLNIFFTNLILAKKYAKISILATLKQMFIPIGLCVICIFICSLSIYQFNANFVLVLIEYGFAYVLLSKIFKLEVMDELKSLLLKILSKQ